MDSYKGKHHFPTEGNKVYIREMHVLAQGQVVTHRHRYEHYSILAQGEAVVEIEGDKQVLVGPVVISIPAHAHHRIKAITDISWFCIHGTDEDDESKIDEVLIEGGV